MVLIMWLTGGKKPPAAGHVLPSAPTVQAPLEVNEAKIVELQNRIQELQREQLVAQNALVQQGHLLSSGAEQAPPLPVSGQSGGVPERADDPLEAEQKKRSYLSRFASNVALSFRKNPQPLSLREAESAPAPTPAFDPATQLAELLKPLRPPAIADPAAPARKDSIENDRKEEPRISASRALVLSGKTYVLFEGTVIETVLLNRLDGQLSGPVECLVTNDVFSHDRQHLLIPAGSKVLGEARKVESFGQSRLAVFFHRLVMPDGYSVSLDHFAGLNQVGDAGLRDQVNNHYLRIFGVSLAVGAVGAAAEGGTSGALTASGSDLLRQGFAQSTAQSAAHILDRFLNVLPTVTIREGHRIKVYLSGDLALPDYASHNIPPNL
jgi:type IV secretion system protein VirB10